MTGIELSDEARRVHAAAVVIDGHNDLPWKIREQYGGSLDACDISRPQPALHTDLPRLRAGGVGAQFWAAYVPADTVRTATAQRYALEQVDLIRRMTERYADTLEAATTAEDIVRIRSQGRIASLVGLEGGHAIENALEALGRFYDLGVRYMTLTHADTLDWVDAATDEPRHGGLSAFGEQVVGEMNRLGMLVDISHVSAAAMEHVLRVSRAPVIASHSAACAVASHPRNVPDVVLRRLSETGGLVMVNFYSGFVHPRAVAVSQQMFVYWKEVRARHPDPGQQRQAMTRWEQQHPMPAGTVGTVVDHIDHIVRVAGIDHVGLGSDYDGISLLPQQLEDVSCFPYITQELLNRGYPAAQVHQILGGNLLRVLRQAEEARDG